MTYRTHREKNGTEVIELTPSKKKLRLNAKPKEIDIELGKFRIKGKPREGFSLMTGVDIDFTIDGKPYQEVIGPCSGMDIHIGSADEIVSIKLIVFPKEGKNEKKRTYR
jgi:hypothetical protein